MTFILKLAIVLDLITFQSIFMDARYMIIKMEETGENVEAFVGSNDGFIEGIINHIVDESKKGIDGGNSNFVFSANCNVSNGFEKYNNTFK